MDIQNRMQKNIEYFRGVEIKGGLYILRVEYPEKWGAYSSENGVIKIARSETAPNEYYYYAKLDETTLDEIFDLMESTVSMNLTAEAKINLMREKVEELKQMFSAYSYEELKHLKLSIEMPKKRVRKTVKAKKTETKPKRKYTRKNKETPQVVEQESVKEEVNV